MATQVQNVLSAEDLRYLLQLPEVAAARNRLVGEKANIYFSVPVTETIAAALMTRLGLTVPVGSQIPMRWLQGDSTPHVDVGAGSFETTYLMYCTASPGELRVGNDSYPLTENTAYMFSEGLSHETRATGAEPRLLLGPMNERAQPVGAPLLYYPTEADALAFTNLLGASGTFTVGDGGPFGPGGGYTHWRLASNSSGTSSQAIVYPNGSVLNADGSYYLYPSIPCFKEGSTILALVDGAETYVPVETLKPGALVKTARDGYKRVVLVGKGEVKNPGDGERTEERLYKLTPAKYPELKEDLYLTGMHAILVPDITEKQRADMTKLLGRIFVTDKKYRLIACVDERAEPWSAEGVYPIWHFALEHTDEAMNYGVYANGGLLVESCNIRFLKQKSNMTLIG